MFYSPCPGRNQYCWLAAKTTPTEQSPWPTSIKFISFNAIHNSGAPPCGIAKNYNHIMLIARCSLFSSLVQASSASRSALFELRFLHAPYQMHHTLAVLHADVRRSRERRVHSKQLLVRPSLTVCLRLMWWFPTRVRAVSALQQLEPGTSLRHLFLLMRNELSRSMDIR